MLSASCPLVGALSEEYHTPTQTHRMDKHLFSAHPSPPRSAGHAQRVPTSTYASERPVRHLMSGVPYYYSH